MEIRIGVTQSPRELSVELSDDDAAVSTARTAISAALDGSSAVLWLTDRRGREYAVPAAKVAYVEFGAKDGDRKLGFGG
ncbi:MAG: DUF3107 domain-containing protein [Ilumatobacteraceae bacterium]|jgi:hypothetical protein